MSWPGRSRSRTTKPCHVRVSSATRPLAPFLTLDPTSALAFARQARSPEKPARPDPGDSVLIRVTGHSLSPPRERGRCTQKKSPLVVPIRAAGQTLPSSPSPSPLSPSVSHSESSTNASDEETAAKSSPSTSVSSLSLERELVPQLAPAPAPLPLSLRDPDDPAPLVAALPKAFPPLPAELLNVPEAVDKTDSGTPDEWLKRDQRLIRLTGKHPFNCEAPLKSLFDAGFLTPNALFYVRNHGAVPRVDAAQAGSWTVEISGLVRKPMRLTLRDLQSGFEGRLPTVTFPVTLVCAGNRRREQNVVQKSLGFNWGAAGVSTALFTGVYLADVLDLCGAPERIRGTEDGAGGHVIFEGSENLPNGKYGTSQRLGWARDKRKGMLLAWAMNGLTLEPDHGYPIRLVVPGQIGGRSVKWLTKIEVSERESQHHLHFWDNKVLPTQLSAEQARSERHWWYDPKYIITELNVNSAIACPDHDERLSCAPLPDPSNPEVATPLPSYTLRGYAYAGGGRRVARVEVSLDEGRSWTLAQITWPEDLYRAAIVEDDPVWGRLDLEARDECFCWCFWKLEVEVEQLRNSGAITVRAMDEGLALQPRDMYWNPTGMMNNWWFRVAIHKETAPDGSPELRFEHPTLAGTKEGGWMQRVKTATGGIDAVLTPSFSVKAGGELADALRLGAAATAQKNEVNMKKEGVERFITKAELEAHRGESEPWFVVQGEVYDGTGFLSQHPGGPESITLVAGEDASEDFMAIHSADAKKQLAQFHIGTLKDAGVASTEAAPATSVDPVFLSKTKWKAAKLVAISHLSPDSRIYRFALQSPDQELGLPTGQHVFVRLKRKGENGETVQRAYTPVSDHNAKGFIELLIKIYFPCDAFPQGGKMTGGFAELALGDTVELKGPLGSFVWQGNGTCTWRGSERKVRKLALICGGSGITPIIQVIRGVLEDATDTETKLWLVDANRTERDILMREELDKWARMKPERFSMHHVLSKAPEGWAGSMGYVGEAHVRSHLPPPSDNAMALLCGPPGLIESACKPNLARLGWDLEKNVVVF